MRKKTGMKVKGFVCQVVRSEMDKTHCQKVGAAFNVTILKDQNFGKILWQDLNKIVTRLW